MAFNFLDQALAKGAETNEVNKISEINEINEIAHEILTHEQLKKFNEIEGIPEKNETDAAVKKAEDYGSPSLKLAVANGDHVNLILSNQDVNRISVEGDRITNVNGASGLFTAKNDDTGAVYINIYGKTKFTLYLVTEKEYKISILVIPKATAGKTVNLVAAPLVEVGDSVSEDTGGYAKRLIKLVTYMVGQERSREYDYILLSKTAKTNWRDLAEIRPVATYVGSKLMGVVSVVRNKTKQEVVLKESYFYNQRTRAVALSSSLLPSKGTVYLYQVVSK
jgi:type-F conjugative transfer system secretin TraK